MPRAYGTTNAAPYASAPAVGAAGDTYFNTTSKTLYLSDGTQWIQVQAGGGGGSDAYFYGQYNMTGSAIPAGSYTQCSFNQVAATNFSVSSQNGAFGYFNIVVGTAGKYLVITHIGAFGSGAAIARVDARIDLRTAANAVKVQRQSVLNGPAANYNVAGTATAVFDAVAGDLIQVYVQPSAANCVIDYGGAYSWIEIVPLVSQGPTGPSGPVGPAGPIGGASFTARGEWSSVVAYNPMEVVTKNGVAFLAMAANTNVDPGSLPAGSFAAISDLQAQIANIGKILPWTPVFRQGVTLSVTIANAWYARLGEWVIGEVNVAFTSSGTAGQPLQMDVPVPIRNVTGGANSQDIGNSFAYFGSNQYFTLLAPNVNYTQFAAGAAYYTTQIVNGNQLTAYFFYPAPVGV